MKEENEIKPILQSLDAGNAIPISINNEDAIKIAEEQENINTQIQEELKSEENVTVDPVDEQIEENRFNMVNDVIVVPKEKVDIKIYILLFIMLFAVIGVIIYELITINK